MVAQLKARQKKEDEARERERKEKERRDLEKGKEKEKPKEKKEKKERVPKPDGIKKEHKRKVDNPARTILRDEDSVSDAGNSPKLESAANPDASADASNSGGEGLSLYEQMKRAQQLAMRPMKTRSRGDSRMSEFELFLTSYDGADEKRESERSKSSDKKNIKKK